MPTVLRTDGFRFVIWPNDHPPPHTHVYQAGEEAVICLGTDDEFPALLKVRGMSKPDVAKAIGAVFQHRQLLRRRWREFHG